MNYEDYCDMVADSIKDAWDIMQDMQDLYDYQQEERDLRCE
jgi:hypothetical protein